MKGLRTICLAALGLIGYTHADAQSEVMMYTSMGNIRISMTDTLTPITVDSFIVRSVQKFYDGLTFHRVIDNFMIQGGDPNGNGTGGPGYTIPDEFRPSLKNEPATLAMANAGPNTGGSQFFINLVNNTHLNNRHTVFGKVTEGFDVAQSIAKVPKGAMDKPTTPVVIDSIRVTQYPNSVAVINNELDINVSPNPNRGVFTVMLPKKKTDVQVLTTGGNVVFSGRAKKKLEVDISKERKGFYIVKARGKKGSSEYRIVVQ